MGEENNRPIEFNLPIAYAHSHKKRKYAIIVAVIIAIFLVIGIYGVLTSRKMDRDRKNAVAVVTSIAEANELENVSVVLRPFSYDGYRWYYADITCSNWGNLAPRKMLATYKSMDDAVVAARLKVGKKRWVSVGDIHSEGDTYFISPSSNYIKKNGEVLYDDYKHSETHSDTTQRSSKSSSSTTSNKDSYGHTKGDAFTIAEKAVKGKLKSPSTAKFCSVTEATIGCRGNTWVVRGWVDAQNGLGSTIRTQFAVTFTFASKDTYSVDSCIVS